MHFFSLFHINFWEISFIPMKFSGNFWAGDVRFVCISEPKFSWKFGISKYLATIGFILGSKILRQFGDEKRFFARLYETSNF